MQHDPNNKYCNHEGYLDLTAYEAEKAIMREESRDKARVGKAIEAAKYVIRLFGFEIEGRITLIDRHTRRRFK